MMPTAFRHLSELACSSNDKSGELIIRGLSVVSRSGQPFSVLCNMVRDTSIEAYRYLKASGRLSALQLAVYEVLFNFGPLSRSETAKHIVGSTRDGVHQRFCELRRFGLIKQVGKRICTVTGKRVYIWDVTSKIPTDLDFKIVPVWPHSYHVVVMPNGEWEYFTGDDAAAKAIAYCDKHGVKVLELKGKTIHCVRG